jgi:5'-deoxynucleotidase YfbR-like HD superfamily hydrolase
MIPPEHHVVGINPIYRSGSVKRWHTYPEVPPQTLADHQGRVAQIVLFFWPQAPASLLYAALHHDCGELITGDVSSKTKRAHPELARALVAAEAIACASMGIDAIDQTNERLIFADRLEAYSYVALHCHHLLGEPDWVSAIAELGKMADALSVSKRLVEWFAC